VHGFLGDTIKDAGDHVAATLNSADNGELVSRAALAVMLPVPVLTLATNLGFIHFDHAHKLAEILCSEAHADPVAHIPSGFVAAEAHGPMDLEGRNALFAGQHDVNDSEPVPEGFIGVLKDGPGDNAEAVIGAGRAAHVAQPSHLNRPVGLYGVVSTPGAPDANGPAMGHQISLASRLVRKCLFPLGDSHLVDALFGLGHDGYSLTMEGI
jgi:hypothetical protein